MGNWVNDLMHNSSMTNPLATCFTAIAMTAKTTNTPRMDNIIRMYTDSVPIVIDNRCSLCISHVPEYFVGNLIPSNRKIKGFGGILSPIIQVGTLLWKWNDDQGQEHKFLIPNSLYIPSVKFRLLSPQHWAQTRQGDPKHAQEITDAQNVTLSWVISSYKLTTPLGKKNNVGTLYMTPGFNNFNLFCQAATEEHHDEHYPMQAAPNLVDDDEDECPENPDDATVQRPWHPSTDSVTPLHVTQEQPDDSEGDLNSEGGSHITQGY